MTRDIDSIIEQVQRRVPNVTVAQSRKRHPADDDGIWWFNLPNAAREIQIESSSGNCPFMIEHDEMNCNSNAIAARNIEDVVSHLVRYLGSVK